MGSEVLIVFTIFATFFGLAYLYFTTRNKERLALIEKGADASIFKRGVNKVAGYWKVIILNLALLLCGVGLGVLFGSFLHNNLGLEEEVAFPATIFLVAGGSLLVGFFLTKKIVDEDAVKSDN